jgi:hypothetical protein
MADATDTTYPLAYDPLPSVAPLDRQNAPGLEHDELHSRANAVLNALQQLVGLVGDHAGELSILERLAAVETGGGAGGGQAVPEHVHAGASYTLTAADAFAMVCMTSEVANTVVVPLNLDLEPGARIDISQDGAGQTSVTFEQGVVVRSSDTLKIRKRYDKASLIRRAAANTYDLVGGLEPAS